MIGIIEKIVGVDKRFAGFDFLPGKIKIGLIGFDKRENIVFDFERITINKIAKAMGVATNKVYSLTGHVDFFSGGELGGSIGKFGNIFPPFLTSFNIVYPRASQKTKAKIFGGRINFD